MQTHRVQTHSDKQTGREQEDSVQIDKPRDRQGSNGRNQLPDNPRRLNKRNRPARTEAMLHPAWKPWIAVCAVSLQHSVPLALLSLAHSLPPPLLSVALQKRLAIEVDNTHG